MNADTYRDSFLQFLAQGMTHREAMECFDREELQRACNEELISGAAAHRFNMATMQSETISGELCLFDLVVKAEFEKRNSIDSESGSQCLALWQAGWTSEDISPPKDDSFWGQTQLMSLYWRAPSKRPSKPGRRYLSTNQAFNAMKKAQA